MKVFLVRHAIAHERSRARWPDDSQRELTQAGKRKWRKAARGLTTLLPRAAPILTSPFVRARATAVILAAVHGGKIVQCPELAAGGKPSATFELLKVRGGAATVLVGHEPDLGRFLAAALGAGSARFSFKKGGAACVEFRGRPASGEANLLWMLPPKVLRALR
jgi:phosphohistidine phosphatase